MTDYTQLNAAADALIAAAVAAQKASDDTAYAALQAKYDAYVAAHPGTPTPTPTPGPTPAPTGWKELAVLDLAEPIDNVRYTSGKIGNNAATFSQGQCNFASGEDGKSLMIVGSGTPSAPKSGEMRLQGISLPPYFRAEVTAKTTNLVSGVWPCPMWFRPSGAGEGEIDCPELYGKEPASARTAHFTIHKTPYGSGHQQSAKKYSIPGDPAATGWHTYAIEKTKGKIAMFVDGVLAESWTSKDVAWFDSMYEVGTKWMPIITLQLGQGTSTQVAGPLPAGWTGSNLIVSSMSFYSQA